VSDKPTPTTRDEDATRLDPAGEEARAASVDEAASDATARATPAEEASSAGEDAAPHKDPRRDGPLGPAWAALERGDHVEARSIAGAIARGEDEAARREAEDFLRRLEPDPVILMVFAATGLLLLLLAWQYLGHRHPR
jgi:hypothetical protein